MKVIEPSFKLSTPYGNPITRYDGIKMLQFIERQARISHRSEERIEPTSWEKLLTAIVLQHGDWSVVEHASLTATIRTDRGITHELVRHRLFGFTQESTRFVRYHQPGTPGKVEMEFIRPIGMKEEEPAYEIWQEAMSQAEKNYYSLLEAVRPQEARSVLPNSLAATIAVTGNLRNWRHFLLMRTSKETHPDFKRITIPMLAEFQKIIPLLFDDIEPDQRQIENMRKPR